MISEAVWEEHSRKTSSKRRARARLKMSGR
jgi:hypothetical protein